MSVSQGLCGQGLRQKVLLQTDGGGPLFVRSQVLSCGLPDVEFWGPLGRGCQKLQEQQGRGLAIMTSASSGG